MTAYTTRDVADYYNQTQVHYLQWWQLSQNLSLHYGIWQKGIKRFADALVNTNRIFMDMAQVQPGERVLDAGCGVGGAAIYLAQQRQAQVTGITLSERQLAYATQKAKERGMDHLANFALVDYTNTTFDDGTFDLVWACESVSSAINKQAFVAEAYRVLKPGGRLVMSDFFVTPSGVTDAEGLITKWRHTWSINNFETLPGFTDKLQKGGFAIAQTADYTEGITPTARRMYQAYLLGAIPSTLYNLTHKQVTHFARGHYLCGKYQYKALKKGLWQYHIVLATKPA